MDEKNQVESDISARLVVGGGRRDRRDRGVRRDRKDREDRRDRRDRKDRGDRGDREDRKDREDREMELSLGFLLVLFELVAKAGVFLFEEAEAGVFLFELVEAGAEGGDFFVGGIEFFFLVGAEAEAGSGHTLFDAAFGDKFLFFILQISLHHGVYHAAEGYRSVGKLLIGPAVEERFVVFNVVVFLAEGQHRAVARVGLVP